MMDSQEKALEQGQNEVIKEEEVSAQTVEAPVAEPASQVETNEEQPQKVYATKAEILERVREIAHSDETPQKEEVDYLKTVFYKLHIAEREAHFKAYIDGGGDPNQYQLLPDSLEEAFKAEMGIVKEKRAKLFKEQEAEKLDKLAKKLDIIEKIKAMITSPEDANKGYQEFKSLQQQWREIKNVPADKAAELWRNYQLYVEQFYDMLRLNSIARDEDFKKNLEAKTRLCEIAENLANEEDVISAFHQLQKLHQEYREIGPVAKEQREEIWNRFKAASTVINKRHQQHFEGIRAREEDNLARKTVLCEKVEAIAAEENKGSGDWEKHTKQIIEIQTEWKTIGFAPQKMNVKIFERFRAACDDFFGRKAEFFKTLKDSFKENADKKRALIEKAKALQDSTEWKSTADKLIVLQPEDDAAMTTLGNGWRMPTREEAMELFTKCTFSYNKPGLVTVTGPNGNTIDFPKTGYYVGENLQETGYPWCWTASMALAAGTPSGSENAIEWHERKQGDAMRFGHTDCYGLYRENGLPIRPVKD